MLVLIYFQCITRPTRTTQANPSRLGRGETWGRCSSWSPCCRATTLLGPDARRRGASDLDVIRTTSASAASVTAPAWVPRRSRLAMVGTALGVGLCVALAGFAAAGLLE